MLYSCHTPLLWGCGWHLRQHVCERDGHHCGCEWNCVCTYSLTFGLVAFVKYLSKADSRLKQYCICIVNRFLIGGLGDAFLIGATSLFCVSAQPNYLYWWTRWVTVWLMCVTITGASGFFFILINKIDDSLVDVRDRNRCQGKIIYIDEQDRWQFDWCAWPWLMPVEIKVVDGSRRRDCFMLHMAVAIIIRQIMWLKWMWTSEQRGIHYILHTYRCFSSMYAACTGSVGEAPNSWREST